MGNILSPTVASGAVQPYLDPYNGESPLQITTFNCLSLLGGYISYWDTVSQL